MVRGIIVACFVLALAVPAMAQEDYPRVQTSLGYANLSLDDVPGRHSGFANETAFNLTRTFGINNYMGIYSLGQNTTLIADFFGGKATWRAARIAPYGVAGVGVGYLTDNTTFGSSGLGARIGGGADVPLGETMAIKFEYSRVTFRWGGSWFGGNNLAAGIVFTLSQ